MALAAEGVRWPRGGLWGGPPPSRADNGWGGPGLAQGQALWASRRGPIRAAASRGAEGREASRQTRLENALLRRGLDPLATRREWVRVPRGGPGQKAALDASEAERRERAGRMRRTLTSDEERQEFLTRLGARDDGDYGAVVPEAWLLLEEKGGAVTRFNTSREELIRRGLVESGPRTEGEARARARELTEELASKGVTRREAANATFADAMAAARGQAGVEGEAAAGSGTAPPPGRGPDDGQARVDARLAELGPQERAAVEQSVKAAMECRQKFRELFPDLGDPAPSPSLSSREHQSSTARWAVPEFARPAWAGRSKAPPGAIDPRQHTPPLSRAGTESGGATDLVTCDNCGREFAITAIARHQRMCRRVAQRRGG